jgi:hypothetical protein
MKHPFEWAATHVKKPGYFCALQIIAGLVSANAAGVFLSHFQALGHVVADPIGHRSGGEILHSVAVFARLSGDIEIISLVAPLAGAVIGTLLTIMLGAIGNRHRGCFHSTGAPF